MLIDLLETKLTLMLVRINRSINKRGSRAIEPDSDDV
jgi:hypothetical protein